MTQSKGEKIASFEGVGKYGNVGGLKGWLHFKSNSGGAAVVNKGGAHYGEAESSEH